MLVGKGPSSLYMYNALKEEFEIDTVIIEDQADQMKFLKRRFKRLGFFKVLGQILFQLTIPKLLKLVSKRRRSEIIQQYNLSIEAIPESIVKNVSSVNSECCKNLLIDINPSIIIVNGTRIISKKVLSCVDSTFINTHVGITPKYRGVYGGYWAVANNDLNNFGTTVHLVDPGIDTGDILYQGRISIKRNDNFSTYPLLQIGIGTNLIKKALRDALAGDLTPQSALLKESILWYHPTLWYYLFMRVYRNVK